MQHSARVLRFPLAKYSRATDVPKDADKFTWTHVQHDLTLVFDNVRKTENGAIVTSQVLRVLHGGQVLEAIPIQDLIAESEDVVRTLVQLKVQVRNEQLPISALHRRPLFALRCNVSEDKVRRLQLKFTTSEDFDRCVSHVRSLGLRITSSESRPVTATASTGAPAATQSATTGSSFPTSRLGELKQRPSTAAAFTPPTYVNPTLPRVSSPLARHSISAASDREEQRSVSNGASAGFFSSYGQSKGADSPLPKTNPLEPPEYFLRPDSSSSSFERPASSFGASRNVFREIEHGSSGEVQEELSTFPTVPSSAAMLASHHQSSDAALPPKRELPFARSTPPKSAGSDTARPVSRASSGSGGLQSSSPAEDAGSRSRRSSGVMGPPPLPAPSQLRRTSSIDQRTFNSADTSTNNPASFTRAHSYGHGSAMEIDRPSLSQATHEETAPERTPARQRSTSRPPSRHSSRPFNGGELDLPPLPQPTFVDSLAPQANPTSPGRPETPNRVNSSPPSYGLPTSSDERQRRPFRTSSSSALNIMASPPALPSLSINLNSAANSTNGEPSHQARFFAALHDTTNQQNRENLASFAAKSEDEQRAAIDDFLLNHLEDPNFINLCEAVSISWTRIGLGLE